MQSVWTKEAPSRAGNWVNILKWDRAWVVYELRSLCSGSLGSLAEYQLFAKGMKGRSYRVIWVLLLKDLLKMDIYLYKYIYNLAGGGVRDGSTFKTILTSNMIWNSLYRIGWVCNPASFRCWDYRHSYCVLFISILLIWFGLSHSTSYLWWLGTCYCSWVRLWICYSTSQTSKVGITSVCDTTIGLSLDFYLSYSTS